MLNIPRPPYSVLGYNRAIPRTHIKVLLNIGPGAGRGTKKGGQKSNLSNTFDDDCISKLYHFLIEKMGRYRRVNLPPPYTFSASFSLLPKIGGGEYATPALSRKESYLTFRASLLGLQCDYSSTQQPDVVIVFSFWERDEIKIKWKRIEQVEIET